MGSLRSLGDLLRDVIQVAYVTDDIDRAARWLTSTMGTSEVHVRRRSSLAGRAWVDGARAQEWVIDVAMVNAGPTNIEVIRPVSGAVDLYRGAIRPDRPATFHHLGVRVDDFDQATAVVEAAGRSWKQHGAIEGSIRFGYLDLTEELGHQIEVMELGAGMTSYLELLEDESNRPL